MFDLFYSTIDWPPLAISYLFFVLAVAILIYKKPGKWYKIVAFNGAILLLSYFVFSM